MYVREMQSQDLDTITDIENDLCESPWSKEIFEDCLKTYKCFVIEDKNNNLKTSNGKTIGYAVISIILDESHLLNFAIIKEKQHQGFGYKFMKYIMEYAKKNASKIMFLEVRKNNFVATSLYQKLGFKQIGIREDYYTTKTGKEDALVFANVMTNP